MLLFWLKIPSEYCMFVHFSWKLSGICCFGTLKTLSAR